MDNFPGEPGLAGVLIILLLRLFQKKTFCDNQHRTTKGQSSLWHQETIQPCVDFYIKIYQDQRVTG